MSLLRAAPGRVPWANQPPGARLRAPTPGLDPGWGPGDANLGDVNVTLHVYAYLRGGFWKRRNITPPF